MIFLIIFGVGLVMAIVVFILGEIFDFGDFGGDSGDALGAETPSPLSSRIVFVFMTAFGGIGFIAQSSGLGTPVSVLAGLLGGVAVAGGTFFLIVLPMARQQGSVRLSIDDLLDMEGQVTDDIPEGGVGKVTLVPRGTGARISRAARSQNGSRIPPGTTVKVVHVGAGSLTVTPTEFKPFAGLRQAGGTKEQP